MGRDLEGPTHRGWHASGQPSKSADLEAHLCLWRLPCADAAAQAHDSLQATQRGEAHLSLQLQDRQVFIPPSRGRPRKPSAGSQLVDDQITPASHSARLAVPIPYTTLDPPPHLGKEELGADIKIRWRQAGWSTNFHAWRHCMAQWGANQCGVPVRTALHR